MDESDFEGTVVLEKVAEVSKIDEFFDAVDADDFAAAGRLMRAAAVDEQTIAIVLRTMRDPGTTRADPGRGCGRASRPPDSSSPG